jgi:hypothetical protein
MKFAIIHKAGKFLMILFMIVGISLCAQEKLDIVKDNKAYAVIVTAGDAPAKVKSAARELQSYIKKMSGAELPIETDSKKIPGKARIIVGKSNLEKQFGVSVERGEYPVPENFTIKSGKDVLFLVGNDEGDFQGTLFAVYDFLESLGCRWFAPGDLWEVVPEMKNIEISTDLNRTEKPECLARRGVWYHYYGKHYMTPEAKLAIAKNGEWRLRNKGNTVRLPSGHALKNYVGKSYFKKHPEYFPLVNGKRIPSQVCYTNDEVVKIIVDKLRKKFDSDPGLKFLSLAENDSHGYCECAACEKIGGTGKDKISRKQVYFLNRIAAEIKKSHPGKILTFMAYRAEETGEVPSGMKAEDNLLVSVISYAVNLGLGYCYSHDIDDKHCPIIKKTREVIEGWGKAAKQTMYSEHINDAATVMGRPFVQCSKKFIPFLIANNCLGYLEESSEHSWLSMGPHNYVVMKLLWNSRQDADKLIDEYYSKLYGKSAGLVKEYYQTLTGALAKAPHRGHAANILPPIFTPVLGKCGRILAQAYASNNDPVQKKRLKCLVTYFTLLKKYCQAGVAVRQFQQDGKEESRKKAEKLVLDLEKYSQNINNETRIVHKNILLLKDLKPLKDVVVKAPLIPEVGDFKYIDHYSFGGKAKLDSAHLSGFYIGRYGLYLRPGVKGKIIYKFDAPDNSSFEKATLRLIVNDIKDIALKISTDGGKTFAPLKIDHFIGARKFYALTDLVKGKASFQLELDARHDDKSVKLKRIVSGISLEGKTK